MKLGFPWRQVLGTTLVFAVLGPLAGALPWAAMMLYETIHGGHGAVDFNSVVGSFLGLAFFAYLFGLIPAALAGFVAGFARQRWSGWRWVLACAFIGLGVATVYGVVVFTQRDDVLGTNVLTAMLMFGLPGSIGGAVAGSVLTFPGLARKPAI